MKKGKSRWATFSVRDVSAVEKEYLLKKRSFKTHPTGEMPDDLEQTKFGLALSGGGIRSATINVGFLQALNECRILEKADYLSTVSGGGYTGAYVQGTLKYTKSYNALFVSEHIERLRKVASKYMSPNGFTGTMILIWSYLASLLFSLVNPAIFVAIGYLFWNLFTDIFTIDWNALNPLMIKSTVIFLYGFGGLMAFHFLYNVWDKYNLDASKQLVRIELAVLALGGLVASAVLLWHIRLHQAPLEPDFWLKAALMTGLFTLGFFTNPDAFSFSRFYRKQLADAFLYFSGSYRNARLCDLILPDSDKPEDFLAPYPLINTCLNLEAGNGDDKFLGTQTQDYFLLSPLYCGAKLTSYIATGKHREYRRLTLPAATSISAAAVNSSMGVYSSKGLGLLITLLNARLGAWMPNPLQNLRRVWWPVYFLRDLLSDNKGSDKAMINISDGGHIENLAAFELLRRHCRLIICMDAGEDGNYAFEDLYNLIRRCRNELGLEIRFREGNDPETIIKPARTYGYSRQRFAVADVLQWWENVKIIDPATQTEHSEIVNFEQPRKIGTFVYVKSSVTAPVGMPNLADIDRLRSAVYRYKLYQHRFPHDSTSDQFYDPIQWEAYYQLGYYLALDVLGLPETGAVKWEDLEGNPLLSRKQLFDFFDNRGAGEKSALSDLLHLPA